MKRKKTGYILFSFPYYLLCVIKKFDNRFKRETKKILRLLTSTV